MPVGAVYIVRQVPPKGFSHIHRLKLAHDFVVEFCGSGAPISCLDEGANMVANAVCIVQIASAILVEGELALLEKVVYSHQMLNQCRFDQSSREVLCVVYLVQTATD